MFRGRGDCLGVLTLREFPPVSKWGLLREGIELCNNDSVVPILIVVGSVGLAGLRELHTLPLVRHLRPRARRVCLRGGRETQTKERTSFQTH